MGFLQNLYKLFTTLTFLFLFGYFEAKYRSGVAVTVALFIYFLFYCKIKSWLTVIYAIALLSSEIALITLVNDYKFFHPIFFLLLDVAQLLVEEKTATDDTVVQLLEYEQEIRSLLIKHNPTLLHKVDNMLLQNKGKEKQLYDQLKVKFANGSQTSSSSGSTSVVGSPWVSPILGVISSSQNSPCKDKGDSVNYASDVSKKLSLSPYFNKKITAKTDAKADFRSSLSPPSSASKLVGVEKDIYEMLSKHDPILLPSLKRLLQEYEGKEYKLLEELKQEYTKFPSSRSYSEDEVNYYQNCYQRNKE